MPEKEKELQNTAEKGQAGEKQDQDTTSQKSTNSNYLERALSRWENMPSGSDGENSYLPIKAEELLHAVELVLMSKPGSAAPLSPEQSVLLASVQKTLSDKLKAEGKLSPTQEILLLAARKAQFDKENPDHHFPFLRKRLLQAHESLLTQERLGIALSPFQKRLLLTTIKALSNNSSRIPSAPSDSPFRDTTNSSTVLLKKKLEKLEEQIRDEQTLMADVKSLQDGFQSALANLNDVQARSSTLLENASLRLESIDTQADTAQKRIDALAEQAGGIISKVSTGALGDAFIKEITNRTWKLIVTRFIFVALLAIIFLLTLFILLISWHEAPKDWLTDPKLAIPMALRLFVLEMPLIWLANVVSRRMHMQERILEEYIHKKNVALTYTAIQTNLENLYGTLDTPQAETSLKAFTEGFAMAALRDPCDFYDKQPRVDNPLYRLADTLKETVSSAKESK